jgi:hypothetical protein
MSLKNPKRGPKARQIVPWEGAYVVACSYWATAFFTGCESDSRLTVSLVTHTEALDVFA